VAPKVASAWDEWGVTVVVVAVAVVAAIGGVRLLGGWNARRRRRTVLLKPSSKFDPSAEEVLRFCGQLSRVHNASARVTVPRSTRVIRVTLISAGEGRMAQLLSGPAAAEQILRHRGFAQVELADATVMLSAGVSGPGSEATEEEAAKPSESISTAVAGSEMGGTRAGSRVDDPLDPDLEVGAEDWLDSDHGGHLDDPPEDLEWMHPEEQRLHPVPSKPLWDCLDEEDRG
ncbi:MAG: hypothetical protein OEY55_14170, partial [Acidimicrobiia bacterium]|nr:hypothetical protein [Acidimicrobiia bacterium]